MLQNQVIKKDCFMAVLDLENFSKAALLSNLYTSLISSMNCSSVEFPENVVNIYIYI